MQHWTTSSISSIPVPATWRPHLSARFNNFRLIRLISWRISSVIVLGPLWDLSGPANPVRTLLRAILHSLSRHEPRARTHCSPLSLSLVSRVRAIFPTVLVPVCSHFACSVPVARFVLRNVTCAFRSPLSSKDSGFEAPPPCLKLRVLDSRNVTGEEAQPCVRHRFLVSSPPLRAWPTCLDRTLMDSGGWGIIL